MSHLVRLVVLHIDNLLINFGPAFNPAGLKSSSAINISQRIPDYLKNFRNSVSLTVSKQLNQTFVGLKNSNQVTPRHRHRVRMALDIENIEIWLKSIYLILW